MTNGRMEPKIKNLRVRKSSVNLIDNDTRHRQQQQRQHQQVEKGICEKWKDVYVNVDEEKGKESETIPPALLPIKSKSVSSSSTEIGGKEAEEEEEGPEVIDFSFMCHEISSDPSIDVTNLPLPLLPVRPPTQGQRRRRRHHQKRRINKRTAGAATTTTTTATSEQLKRTRFLYKLSSFASFICLIDCTLLPFITLILPLFGFVSGSNQRPDNNNADGNATFLSSVHHFGHSLTLFFVMPVGLISSILSYMQHRNKVVSSMAIVGLIMIGIANSFDLPIIGGHIQVFHIFHQGFFHRIVNAMGCACLLSSNYLSHQLCHKILNSKGTTGQCCILHPNYPPPINTTPTASWLV